MNVGTATEIKWLKKFNENGIYPFGIINRIDELDEEEDDLEGLIDFNKPRLGPSVQKLIGVSARDALVGKLQKNTQILEWSNWGDVEQLLEKFKKEVNKKLERAYKRLLQPIRQMDQLTLERKISLPLKKLNTKNVESFVKREFPELLLTKERLEGQKEITMSVHDGWNLFLNTTIDTMDSLDRFLRSFMVRYKEMGGRATELKNDPLTVWEKMVPSQSQSFYENRKEYNDKVDDLNQEREALEQNWKDIHFSNLMFKKARLNKHQKKLEFYDQEREKMAGKHQVLTDLFSEMVKKLDVIQQSVNAFVENDFHFYVKNERKELDSWNRQLEKVQKYFVEFSESDLAQIEVFSQWLNKFQENIAVPLLNAGQTFENFLAYEEASYLLGNLAQLGHDLPPKEFYSQWRRLNGLSKEKQSKYDLHFPNLTPPELLHHELKGLPAKLKHNIQAEIDAFIAERNQWLKHGGAIVFVVLIIAIIAYSTDQSSSGYNDRDNTEDAATGAQSLEEEKQALEDQFPKENVEEFLKSAHQQLEYDPSSHDPLFSNYGWDSYFPYYDIHANGELVTFDITSVEYLSGDEIKATVKETYKQSGVLKDFETDYTLTMDSNTGEGLMISAFSYKLVNETETEIALEDGKIEEFLGNFRSAYMQALNEEDYVYINDFFDQDSPAYKELQTYIASIAGKGYNFEELGFQVDKVEKANINEYKVSTSEKFMFTDEKEEKTSYEKTKDYKVKVIPEKGLVIKEITTNNTTKETVKEPTVQLVTSQDVNDFILRYYTDFEDAFNGKGFTYVQNYYDPNGSGYDSAEAYINKANSNNMHMNNLEMSVESVSEADENHYLVTVNFVDEYAYQGGSGDRKQVHANFKVRVSNNGEMMISENPSIEILEKTKY
jgi:hypothetical protein